MQSSQGPFTKVWRVAIGLLLVFLLFAEPTHAQSNSHLPSTQLANLSKEGKIAFVSDRDGNLEIYVMNADGSGLTNLTNNPTVDRSPVWSPDGQKIAFLSDRSGASELYVMSADGTDIRRLTNLGGLSAPIWSPDGRRIAFRQQTGEIGANYKLDIYWINSDGSDLTRVYSDATEYILDHGISWSPDGLQLLFAVSWIDSAIRQRADLRVVNLDGTGLHTLAGTDLPESQPAWSPDGQWIAFQRQSTNQITGLSSDIFVVTHDGSQELNLTQSIVTGNCCVAWSPDSQWLAFTATLDQSLYVAQVGSWQLTRVYKGSSSNWSWSPDSQWLTFSSTTTKSRMTTKSQI